MRMNTIDDLLNIMKSLRDPVSGCPWDIRQTNASIASYTLEETHETLDAIERGDMGNLCEELGDLLFHVVFHARIAEENGEFDFPDVVEAIVTKMTRRHPHVFGDQKHHKLHEDDIKELWQSIKKKEKACLPEAEFGDDSRSASAICRAQQLQQQAAEFGFDWPNINPVLDKLEEEIEELRTSIEVGDVSSIEDELGDVLFVCANIARHNQLNAETALRGTNQKFIRRFKYVKNQMIQSNIPMTRQQLELMEQFWQESKSIVG
ncbi:MAG: nucleoside triphosphate pyrophosphohydrolase [Gammaproteobacteria bacterium]|nr:nucleoside triphosphate pyrophosphohydrolase [Gammaproteobacteria bacterium]